MTYKELLQQLADQASSSYKQYLQSKIQTQENAADELLPDQTQQYKDAYEGVEKKFSALLATSKKDEKLDEQVPDGDIENFLT